MTPAQVQSNGADNMAERLKAPQVAEMLKTADKVAVFGHFEPDGDCFGSVFGLKIILESMDKKVFTYISNVIPPDLYFLKDYDGLKSENDFKAADLAIVLDSSDVLRTENHGILEQYREKGTKIFLIDHHTPGNLLAFADYAWQDAAMSSTSQMITEILMAMDAKITKDVATLLLTGIQVDTSSFQNQNTTAEVMEVAAFLLSKGARHTRIIKNTFQTKDMEMVKLYGAVLERLIYNKKYGAIVGYLTQEDLKNLSKDGDFPSGISNYLNTIEDAKMIIFMSETEDGFIKVSLRTRDENVDVSKLAKVFGGGGHVKASGFSFKGKIVTENGQVRVV